MIILSFFWIIYFRERKTRKLKACDNCSEYGKGEICSGFRIQAQRIRRFEEEATEFIINSGYVPDLKKRV
ncbi:hypothetical protein QUF80_11670 [Desulfococcaceae bacterium HSG8]|nr:hypothetical protein [Desulfococcaceae bacterium HSG8]